MPVIISKDDYDYWLDSNSNDREKLLSLLKPYDSEKIELYTVSQKVNSPSYNAPDNIAPIDN